ncbi:hypothetical protein L0B53_03430 [Vibrio sp. SS-MA-C1-2]|uniref:hypothetical protein n=1 Tax=Vibrio sp. SS-MA-C1-2 TaxID=2908646 RepID=UPI001F4809FC|nr:hypothetical protein [Vibrio sp. SS-MA-C1-2]UJF17006.1 hypothetical protein L0B53_03430 [Vibrio sp. SS-MA-C1-2]
MNNTIKFVMLGSVIALVGCKTTESEKLATNNVLEANSPWATTSVYQVVGSKVDRSVDFIDDATISNGTISSAQYRDGTFMFIGMADHNSGEFNTSQLTASIENVYTNNAAPSGFSFGNFEIMYNNDDQLIRRLSNPSFNTSAVIDRVVTKADSDEFGYTFQHSNGNTYYVEHKPYAESFPEQSYPVELATTVNTFYQHQLDASDTAYEALTLNAPWATTAVYKEVDGEMDTSVNYIDTDIANGTISSAQYRDGKFMFIFMSDHHKGTFNENIASNIEATIEGSDPKGFVHGEFSVELNENGDVVRKLFGGQRIVTEATNEMFTYKMVVEGETYFVEHQPYALAFPKQQYPVELEQAVNDFFYQK